jgi:hypothetical protein
MQPTEPGNTGYQGTGFKLVHHDVSHFHEQQLTIFVPTIA